MLKKNAKLKKRLGFKERALKYARIIRYRILIKHNTKKCKRITIIARELQCIILKILHSCRLCSYRPFWWQAAFSKTTFLLCVRPKNRPFSLFKLTKKNTSIKNFPPPGYGVPPGYKDLIQEHNYQTKEEYGLYLSPGRINIAIIVLTVWLSIIVCAPFINEYSNPTYPVMVIGYWFLAWVGYYFLFTKMMSASLTQVWEKWPLPAYELFLSVPHNVIISQYDRLTKKHQNKENKKEKETFLDTYHEPKQYIFWRPDKKTPMWRQSTENSPDMHTLQDLILNLAVFEFLFHKNNPESIETESTKKNKSKSSRTIKLKPSVESIHEYNWYFFLFSPIIINLLLILLSIFLFSFLAGQSIETTPTSSSINTTDTTSNIHVGENQQITKIKNFQLVTHFPYNFVIAVLSWFLFTLYYVHWVLETLTDLSKKIHNGYFNAQLDLIPQQILNELSYIPTQQQVDNGIAYVKTILNWSSSIIFLGLMAMFEIFSQAYSASNTNYHLWEKITNLLSLN